MKILATIFLFFIFSNHTFCQQKPITKKELTSLIKRGIIAKKEEYKESWLICNKDSIYFKSDTLVLYGAISNTSHIKDCCKYVGWNFTSLKKMYQSSINTCRAPVIIGQVLTELDFYKIKIIQVKETVILKRYNKGKVVDSYKVLNYTEVFYDKINSSPVITLIRQ